MKAIIPILKLVSLYGIIGLVVGTVAGVFGVGGGILMVPAANIIFGREMKVAVGTSLAAIVLISLAAALRHHISYQNVDIKLAMAMAIGAIVGSVCLGAPLAEVLPQQALKRSFGYFAMCVGFYYTGLPGALWHRLHQ